MTSASDEEPLVLLRTNGLSIKAMDETKKAMMRAYLESLTGERGMSLNDVAKLVGNKTSGYASWVCRQLGVKVRPFEEARLKGIKEKRRKYERKPFDGTDEDRAYMLGVRHGDLSVSKPWNGVVRVSTSTTHPAMAELFHSLFEPYGHVYQHPRYKKDTSSYEWNLSTILDSSFDFLMLSFEESIGWLGESDTRLIAYLSGLLDAEGSIVTTRNSRGLVTLFFDINNTNKVMLDWVRAFVLRWGYHCSVRINKRRGVRTKKYGIVHRVDYWQLSSYGMRNIKLLIGSVRPRHSEKVRRQRIALSVHEGQLYSTVEESVKALRAQIKQEVQEFVRQAEVEYNAKHAAKSARLLTGSAMAGR